MHGFIQAIHRGNERCHTTNVPKQLTIFSRHTGTKHQYSKLN